MDSFNKTWKALKRQESGQKRTSTQANLPKKTGSRKKSKTNTKPRKKNVKFTAGNVRLIIEKWYSKPLKYWKQNFGEWQKWCMNALSLDRSSVADAASERTIIERFAKPKRFMLYRKMGLKELKREGLGWDVFLMDQMKAACLTRVEAKDNNGKTYTAELSKTQKKEILLREQAAKAIKDSRSGRGALHWSDIAAETAQDDDDLSNQDSDEDAIVEDEEEDDSDIEFYMAVANNNANNKSNNQKSEQNTLKMKKERAVSKIPPKILGANDDDDDIMLSSLQNIDDMMFDLSQASGKDMKSGVNEKPLFDVEEMMHGALDRMKDQRIKEIKDEKKKDDAKFSEMIDQWLMHMIDSVTNGTLKMQLFSLSLNAPLSSMFFAWIPANFGALVDFYGVGLDVDTFGFKVAKIMQQGESSFQAFLHQWMLWRTLYDENVREVISKIDALMNKMIGEASMPELDAGDDNQEDLKMKASVPIMAQEAIANNDQSLAIKSGKLEIEDE